MWLSTTSAKNLSKNSSTYTYVKYIHFNSIYKLFNPIHHIWSSDYLGATWEVILLQLNTKIECFQIPLRMNISPPASPVIQLSLSEAQSEGKAGTSTWYEMSWLFVSGFT